VNEREEFESQRSQIQAQINSNRSDANRMLANCRSFVLLTVQPDGALTKTLVTQGYTDLRILQIESREYMDEMMAKSKTIPLGGVL